MTICKATIRKAVAIALMTTSMTVAFVNDRSQATAASIREAVVDEPMVCHQLVKLQSQRFIAQDDLAFNRDILSRLYFLYEQGAVAEASYIEQRQVVARLMAQQRKIDQSIQQMRFQNPQLDCAPMTAIEQLERSHQIRNQEAVPRRVQVVPPPR